MKNEKISGCLIVKNEAETIEKCIQSMLSILDELIVIDTGSTDCTVELAKKYTNLIYSYTWKDDFAEARNFAISKASYPWIIFLDADEYFSERSLSNIRKTIDEENGSADAFMINGYNISLDSNQIADKFTVVRVFRNHPKIKYYGRIHESLKKTGNFVIADCTDIIEIFHTGYNRMIVEKQDKNERNIILLKRDLEDNPSNGNAHFYLSQQYVGMEKYEKVQFHANEALKHGISAIGREANAYVNYIHSSLMLKNKSLASLIELCNECINKHPKYPDIYLLLAECLFKNSQIENAVRILEDFLSNDEWDNELKYVVSSLNNGVYGRIYSILGDMYLQQYQDLHKAVFYYTKFLRMDIYNEGAFQKLIHLLVQNGTSNHDLSKFIEQMYSVGIIRDVYFLSLQFAKLGYETLKEHYKEQLRHLG